MGKRIDLTGQTFGRLTVISMAGLNQHGEALWWCGCTCGRETTVPGHRIRNGHTKSCGCLKASTIGDRSRTHGMSKTPAYMMYYDACKRARQRGQKITITPADIVIPRRCPVLGIELKAGGGLRAPCTPSLDCIDPKKGYVPGNVIVVSWRYNKFKADLSPAELRRIAKFVLR